MNTLGVLEEDVERGWTRCKQRTGLKAKEDSRLWAEGDPALVNAFTKAGSPSAHNLESSLAFRPVLCLHLVHPLSTSSSRTPNVFTPFCQHSGFSSLIAQTVNREPNLAHSPSLPFLDKRKNSIQEKAYPIILALRD